MGITEAPAACKGLPSKSSRAISSGLCRQRGDKHPTSPQDKAAKKRCSQQVSPKFTATHSALRVDTLLIVSQASTCNKAPPKSTLLHSPESRETTVRATKEAHL